MRELHEKLKAKQAEIERLSERLGALESKDQVHEAQLADIKKRLHSE